MRLKAANSIAQAEGLGTVQRPDIPEAQRAATASIQFSKLPWNRITVSKQIAMLYIPDKLPFRVCSWPLYTIGLAIFCIAAHAHQQLSDWLAYDRTAIQAGEIWRLLTGHITHYSADHLLWDALMFVVLGLLVEGRCRGSFVVTVLASATAITVVLWFAHPQVAAYRGLSGIDSALFTHYAILLHRDGRRFNQPLLRHTSVALLLAFAAKLVYEITTGNTLFVDSIGFISLTMVHAVGGLAGAVSAVCMPGSVSRRPSSSDRGLYPNSRRDLALSAR